MVKHAVEDADLSRTILASLMDEEADAFGPWSPSDLRALLEHQLDTELRSESPGLARHALGAPEAAEAEIHAAPYRTFFDVLTRGGGEDGVLLMVKEYAKHGMAELDGLPRPVAHFVYVASVLRARAAGVEGFSALEPAALESEARRLLTLHWLPERARDLLRAGLDA